MPKDAAATGLVVAIGQASMAGAKPENQDFHGALVPQGADLALKGVTLALADGISSSDHGREAAEMAVKALLSDYYATPEGWTVETAATRVICATNGWLSGLNAGRDVNRGHVCTLAALILKGRVAHVLHVGDSRVSRLAGRSLEPLTTDHRVTLGPGDSQLSRALGAEDRVRVDYARTALAPGDVFVLSTDGVHEHVDGRVIRDAIAAAPDLDAAARTVLAAALAAGSRDNLTVQIARIDALPDPGPDLGPNAGPDLVHGGAGLGAGSADLPVPPPPQAGAVIDGFRIAHEIHATARSRVYLATDPAGARVALKIPAADTAADPAYLRRFLLEEWVLARVSSPHVLAAARRRQPRSALYVVTDFVEGRTLRQWMTDHPRADLDAVRAIARQLVAGLRALHRRGMVHQDLRPENVMIDTAGTVKIIDLGSASVAGVEEAAPGLLGQQPGTFQYTAPEYFCGEWIGWQADQYALAAIVYEMLTGRLPYGAQVARIHSRRDRDRLAYAPARAADNAVPDWVDAALRRACHPDPARRYPALGEFLADLARPGDVWEPGRHVPLAERNPVRFWQGVSALLALACLILAARLAAHLATGG
ncbi:protein kinase domain-containing protein [Frigidibacter sp. MR17.24]|uniref:protein kinase domain-containing protein n=1 Tax=Frigidibacter sp. MR17.24 TaxID=3127345 RepID=UPI003012D4FD